MFEKYYEIYNNSQLFVRMPIYFLFTQQTKFTTFISFVIKNVSKRLN